MRVQATLDREGHIRLPGTLRLKGEPSAVWVEIPDYALQHEPEPEPTANPHGAEPLSEAARAMLAQLDTIRTSPLLAQQRFPWTAAHQARADAFQLREALRRERTLDDG